jgi:uncharacterized membrane protein YoaK (UPF0700 family)
MDYATRWPPAADGLQWRPMAATRQLTPVEWILLATAFAAGSVDIIGFADLGGVFASAMTGNLALLAYHVAEGNSKSALGSVIALLGFVTGCVIGFSYRRGRSRQHTLNLLLGSEVGLLLFFALYTVLMPRTAYVPSVRLQIAVLAFAMGLQSVVGQTISLTTIVFTSTLTKLVGSITDSMAASDPSLLKDAPIQTFVVGAYLFGAVLAGVLSVHKVEAAVFLPLLGVACALAAHHYHRPQ